METGCPLHRTPGAEPWVGRTQTMRLHALGVTQDFFSLARISLNGSSRGLIPGCSHGIKPPFAMKITNKLSPLRPLQRSFAAALGAILFVGVSSAQSPQVGDPSSLEAARLALATTDFDMDGLVSKQEAEAAGVPESEFAEMDKDKSGSWTGEEFLLYYHGLLKNSGKQPIMAPSNTSVASTNQHLPAISDNPFELADPSLQELMQETPFQ